MAKRDSSDWGVFRDVKPLWELGGYVIKMQAYIVSKRGNKVTVFIVNNKPSAKPKYLAMYVKPGDLGMTKIKSKQTQLKSLFIGAMDFAFNSL